jgi:hypothetical protein
MTPIYFILRGIKQFIKKLQQKLKAIVSEMVILYLALYARVVFGKPSEPMSNTESGGDSPTENGTLW